MTTGPFLIPLNHLTILSTIAIAGGLYFFFAGFYQLSRKRLMLTASTSPIRSVAPGAVAISGEAAGPNTLPATISGRPCFLYHTTAWQQSENKRRWEKVAEETLHLPFFITDSTGQMLVEPLGADLDLTCAFREDYDTSSLSLNLREVPPRVSEFLSRHNLARGRALRIEERLIKPADALFVTGTLTENPGIHVHPVALRGDERREKTGDEKFAPALKGTDGSKSSNESNGRPDSSSGHAAAPQIVKLSSGELPGSAREMTQQGKIAAALNRAGITRPEAWAAAGVPYEAAAAENSSSAAVADRPNCRSQEAPLPEVRRHEPPFQNVRTIEDQARSSDFNLAPPLVMMKSANSPLVIASQRPKESRRAVILQSVIRVWGGAAATLLGLYTLLAGKL